MKIGLLSVYVLFFVFTLFYLEGAWTEIVLNPKGWNLPDTKEMSLSGVESLEIEGIPRGIQVGTWAEKSGTKYRMKNILYGSLPALAANHPVLESPWTLRVYKAADGTHLCCHYARQITDKAVFSYSGVITFICDLNDDGVNEFQMEAGVEPDKVLASIIRIKLGLSDEAELIKRTIRSALRAMKK